jgi:hypothetical protein
MRKSLSLIRAKLIERGRLIRADDLLDAFEVLTVYWHHGKGVAASAVDLADLDGHAFLIAQGPLAKDLSTCFCVSVPSRDALVRGRVADLFHFLFLVAATDEEQRHQSDSDNVTHE